MGGGGGGRGLEDLSRLREVGREEKIGSVSSLSKY